MERRTALGIYYIHTNVICLLLLAGVYMLVTNKREFLPARRQTFRVLVIVAMFLCVSDIFASVLNGRIYPGARLVNEISNMVYYASTVVICYMWMYYVNIRIQPEQFDHQKRRLIYAIPMLITLAVILLNPFLHFFYSIGEDNVYSRNPGVWLQWVVTWGYLIVTMVQVLIAKRNATSRLQKEHLTPLLVFDILPVIGALIQIFFYGVTSMQSGITLSLVMIAFHSFIEQVSSDMLTGLNNRRALDSYIENQLQRPQNVSVLMCDMDDFKAINDHFGHVTGDNALRDASVVLKSACGSMKAPFFLCRYGGDEFLLIGIDASQQLAGQLKAEINRQLVSFNENNHKVYHLRMSIGCASGACAGEDDIRKLIRLADDDMYEQKNAEKSNR